MSSEEFKVEDIAKMAEQMCAFAKIVAITGMSVGIPLEAAMVVMGDSIRAVAHGAEDVADSPQQYMDSARKWFEYGLAGGFVEYVQSKAEVKH